MKTNKSFFDEIDNDWNEVLSNTYKRHNNITLYDTKNNLILMLDNINPIIEVDDIYQDQYY